MDGDDEFVEFMKKPIRYKGYNNIEYILLLILFLYILYFNKHIIIK